MNLMRFRDQQKTRGHVFEQFRTALLVEEGRKWMTLLVIRDGRLALIRRPRSDQKYMDPIQCNQRRAKASLRRLGRKRGTSRKIRQALEATL